MHGDISMHGVNYDTIKNFVFRKIKKKSVQLEFWKCVLGKWWKLCARYLWHRVFMYVQCTSIRHGVHEQQRYNVHQYSHSKIILH